MSLAHVSPGKLFDACRYWYREPQRTRKVLLAGCGYRRLTVVNEDVSRLNWMESLADEFESAAGTTLHRPDPTRFAYDSLWHFGPPTVAGGPRCEELNGLTVCVFGDLTEDESKRSPEVLRFDPKWRTEAVVGIATTAYEDRAFAALPILADALEEAGCDNLPMLSHCREATIHTRGCWVLDHVLGKG